VVSSNGTRIGSCVNQRIGKKCAEVPKGIKGDVARCWLYMSIAYQNQWQGCKKSSNKYPTSCHDIKPDAEQEMRRWHRQDPIDENDIAKNDFIEKK
jgi:endonuclease I